LNGYETPKPLNQKAKELTMAIFVSVSGEQVLKKIENTIAKHFYFRQIKFSSFAMASFAVVRDMHAQENFLLINVGGEVTDISMVKKNTLQESIFCARGCF
jgi:cell division ATPase FtsA